MKFSKIFLIGLAATGLVSCQQDTGDLGKEQQNPQEKMIDPAQLQLSLTTDITGSTIDLNNYYQTNNASLPDHLMIPVMKVDSMGNVPEDALLNYTMEFAPTADYSYTVSLPLDGTSIAYYELQNIYEKLFSNVCFDTKDIYVRVAAEATVGNTHFRFGGQDYYYLTGSKISVSPVKYTGRVLDAIGVNTINAGNKLMGRIDNGKQQYAGFLYITAPFTLKDVSEQGIQLGMGSNGKLAKGSNAAIAVPAEGAGLYFLISTEETETEYSLSLTKITAAGCIGAFNGWAGDATLTASENDLVWSGDVDFGEGGEWKIRFNGGWDISLGTDMNNLNPFPGASNMNLATGGTYTVTLDLKSLPYKVKAVKK